MVSSQVYDAVDGITDRLCFIELVERLTRLRRHLLAAEDLGDRKNREIVRVFLGGVCGILGQLDDFAELLRYSDKLTDDERVTFARTTSLLFSLFRELHVQLSTLGGTWSSPEAHLFLENVRAALSPGTLPHGISVVLHNEYSFEQDDLATGLSDLFLNHGVCLTLAPERPTVFLPKIEHDNPLYWSNLVHECGHIDTKGCEGLLQDPSLYPSGLSADERAILDNWAEEIYCDLFAVKILGPAYLVLKQANAD